MNGPPSDEEGSNGLSDDEEETIFDLIDDDNIDENDLHVPPPAPSGSSRPALIFLRHLL